jgi:drug/metabolite transporter (DMT)-like permease
MRIGKRVTLKIVLFLMFTDVLETLTHFCFKKSVIPSSNLQIHNFHDALTFIQGPISSVYLWLGFLSVLALFIVWTTILSKIDLSVAVPIASFSYILVPIVSIIFLHEKISALRWLGIFFILAGVIFVSLSSQENKEATP